jgi:hypothetical protein
MIVTQLLGGLGNQLFQYAAGRALAERHGTALKLDTGRIGKHRLRGYALRPFAIKAQELTATESLRLGVGHEPRTRLGRLLQRFRRPSIPVVVERGFPFDPSVLESPAHCYLQGYWQSPKYFVSIEEQIRSELHVQDPPAGLNLELGRRIAEGLAVSVHVRRGDYASSPSTNLYHGTCNPEYYFAAEAHLRSRLGELALYVFSDDPDWAQANLRFQSATVLVRHNGPERDYEDLRLMSLCKHHIIANSTFSWWGAWLCGNPGKIVIAPQNWFREPALSTRDLIPDSWIRM